MNWSRVGRSIKSKSKETLKRGATKVGSTSKKIVKKSAFNVGKKLMGQKDPAEQLECLKRCLECITSKEAELAHKCPNCNFAQNLLNDESAQAPDDIENLLQRVNSSDILCYTDGKNSLIFCPSDRELSNKSKAKSRLHSPEEAQTWRHESKRSSKSKIRRDSDEQQDKNHSRSSSLDSLRNSPEVERKRITESKRSGTQNSSPVSPRASPETDSKRSSENQWGDKSHETRKCDSDHSQRSSLKRTSESYAEAHRTDLGIQQRDDRTKPSGSGHSRRKEERYPAGGSRNKQNGNRGFLNDNIWGSPRKRSSSSQRLHEEEAGSIETSIDSQQSGFRTGGQTDSFVRRETARNESHETREPHVKVRRKTASIEPPKDGQGRIQYRKSSLKRRSDQQTDTPQSNSRERSYRSRQGPQNDENYRTSLPQDSTVPSYPEDQDQEKVVEDFGQEQDYSRHSSTNWSRKATLSQRRGSQYETRIPEEGSDDQNYGPTSPSGNVTFNPEVSIDSGQSESQIQRIGSDSISIEQRNNSRRRSGAYSQGFPGGNLETLPEDSDLQNVNHSHNHTEAPPPQELSQRFLNRPDVLAESSSSRLASGKPRTKSKSVLHTSTKTSPLRPSLRERSVSSRPSVDQVRSHLPSPAGVQPSRKQSSHAHSPFERKESFHGQASSDNVCCGSVQRSDYCRIGGGIPCCPSTCCCKGGTICCQNNQSESIYSSDDNKENLTPKDSGYYHHHHHHLFHSPPMDTNMFSCVACNDPNYFESGQRIPEVPSSMCNYHRLQCQRQKIMLSNPGEYGRLAKDDMGYFESPKVHKFRAAISLPRIDLDRNKIINYPAKDDLNDLRLRSNLSCHGLNPTLLSMYPVDPHMLSLLYKNKQKYEDLHFIPPPCLDEAAYLVPGTSYLPPSTPPPTPPPTPDDPPPSPKPKKRKCTIPVTLDYSNQRAKPPKSEEIKSESPEPSLASNNWSDVGWEARATPAPTRRSSTSSDPLEHKNPELLEILRKSSSSTDAHLLEQVAKKLPQNPSKELSVYRSSQSRGSELSGYEAFLLANPDIQPPSACDLDAKRSVEERMQEARKSFYKYLSPDSSMSCRIRATEGRRYPTDYLARTNSMRRPENQLVICECTSIGPEVYDIRRSVENGHVGFDVGSGLPYEGYSSPSAETQFCMLPGADYGLANICAPPVVNPLFGVAQYPPVCDNAPFSESERESVRWAREKEDWKEM